MNDLAKLSLTFFVGLAGGLTGAVLFGGGDPGSVASGGVAAEGDDRLLRTLETRLLVLEGSVEAQRLAYDDLDGRVLAISRRPDLSASLAQAEDAPDAASLSLADLPVGAALTAEVEAVLAKREAEEQARREEERVQRREERVAQTAERISTELGLDASQSAVVKTALGESWAAREAIFEEMRNNPAGGPPDREAIGQKMSEIREAELAQVGGVLTPQQVEAYTSMTNFGRFGGDNGGRQQGATRAPGGAGRDF